MNKPLGHITVSPVLVWPGLGKTDFPLAPLGTTEASTSAREEEDVVNFYYSFEREREREKLGGYQPMVLACTLGRSEAQEDLAPFVFCCMYPLEKGFKQNANDFFLLAFQCDDLIYY